MLADISNFFKILFTDAFWVCFHVSVKHPKLTQSWEKKKAVIAERILRWLINSIAQPLNNLRQNGLVKSNFISLNFKCSRKKRKTRRDMENSPNLISISTSINISKHVFILYFLFSFMELNLEFDLKHL